MRIAPVLLPHLRTPSSALWADVALAALVTHNDATSTSACLAWANILWQLLGMNSPPEPQWWVETYVSVAKGLEKETALRPRGGAYTEFTGPLWRFVAEHVPAVYRNGLTAREACDAWYSGAFLLETVPSVLYILMRHAHDPEEALVRAVNDTKDNDTVAAIVGSAVGALHGKGGLPVRWISCLTGRLGGKDDGHVQTLLTAALEQYGMVA